LKLWLRLSSADGRRGTLGTAFVKPREPVYRTARSELKMKCRIYLCRWPNGEFSVLTAGSRQNAVDKLDEWAGAEATMLKPLDSFMAHFRLSDDGQIELAELGEDTENRIWDECYPELDRVLSTEHGVKHQDGDADPEVSEVIRQAVDRERHRVR
jgi:hypothetical protein